MELLAMMLRTGGGFYGRFFTYDALADAASELEENMKSAKYLFGPFMSALIYLSQGSHYG